jgi:hypothetical protein
MWRPHGGHRETYGCPDPTPFSALYRRSRRMKPISPNRKPRSVFRLDPPSCALPPKKVLVPDPESVPTAIIFYFHRLPYAPHRRYRKPIATAPRGGFLQVVVSKATAADSDEATNFSSAVASDTTLGFLAGSGSCWRLTLCGGPEGRWLNQRAGGQNGCRIFAIFEIKNEISGRIALTRRVSLARPDASRLLEVRPTGA